MATFLNFSFRIRVSFIVRQDHPGPRKAGRAAWRVQAFYEVKSWRKAEFISAAQVEIRWGPRRASALWGGFAVVDVGNDGYVSQFLVSHRYPLLRFPAGKKFRLYKHSTRLV